MKIQRIGHTRSVQETFSLSVSQEDFDALFREFGNKDYKQVLHAADSAEKISRRHPEYLQKHQLKILDLCHNATFSGLKWHLALMLPRITWNTDESGIVWNILMNWASDRNESRIVRTNSIQSLYELLKQFPELERDFQLIVQEIYQENIPSINARLHLLKIIPRPAKLQ